MLPTVCSLDVIESQMQAVKSLTPMHVCVVWSSLLVLQLHWLCLLQSFLFHVYVCVCVTHQLSAPWKFLLVITCVVNKQRTRRSKRSYVVQLHSGAGFVFQTPWQLASRRRRTGSCRYTPASATSARATWPSWWRTGHATLTTATHHWPCRSVGFQGASYS